MARGNDKKTNQPLGNIESIFAVSSAQIGRRGITRPRPNGRVRRTTQSNLGEKNV